MYVCEIYVMGIRLLARLITEYLWNKSTVNYATSIG